MSKTKFYAPYKPSEPNPSWYLNRTEDVPIYEAFERSEDSRCGYCGEEDCEETCEEAMDCKSDNPNDFKGLNAMTLQDIINLIPEGMTASDIKIKMHVDANDFEVEGCSLYFYHVKPLPDKTDLWLAAKAKYDAEYAVYLEEYKKYSEQKKAQEIIDLESKLARLKK